MTEPNKYASFDEMTWPIPDSDLEYRVRFSMADRGDLLRVASIIDAYRELVFCSAKKRAQVIREIRKAATASPESA